MKYKETGEAIIDKMLREGREEEILRELAEIEELVKRYDKERFKIENLYGLKWLYKTDDQRRILGKRFKAYTKLGWIENVIIDLESKDSTMVYINTKPCNNMYEYTSIA